MTGAEHYAEAERLLVHTDQSVVARFGDGDGAECARQQIAMAQVHATLAVAAHQQKLAQATAVFVDAATGDYPPQIRIS